VEEQGTCFVVRGHSGKALTRIYFSEDQSSPPNGPQKFTHNEARHIAASVAQLPELLSADKGKQS
jgi:hypothetical protein